jgi:hypothetical protein
MWQCSCVQVSVLPSKACLVHAQLANTIMVLAKEKHKWRNDGADMAQLAQYMRNNAVLLPRIRLTDLVSTVTCACRCSAPALPGPFRHACHVCLQELVHATAP